VLPSQTEKTSEYGSAQSYPKQLTILPVEVLRGHADVYSKLVPGSSTGCCPVTPKPLHGEQLFLSEINSNHKPSP
jgi:hypothetical protein